MYFCSVVVNTCRGTGFNRIPATDQQEQTLKAQPDENKYTRIVIAVMLVALTAGCSSLGRRAPDGINFTGVWRLSHEMSGNPASLPGISGAANSGAAVSSVAASKSGDPGQLLADLESDRLRIDQSGGKTTITYSDGHTETFDWGKFGYRKVKSGWHKTQFVILRPTPGRHKLVRRYILGDGGDSITIVTVFNKMALTQFYELDKQATQKAFGKPPQKHSQNP